VNPYLHHLEFAFKSILNHFLKTKDDKFIINSLGWMHLLTQNGFIILFELYDIRSAVISVILSSNLDIQVLTVKLITDLCQDSSKLAQMFSQSDITDFLIECLDSTNSLLLESLFDCFCTIPSSEIFIHNLENHGGKRIINSLIGILKIGSKSTIERGFLLIQRIFTIIQNEKRKFIFWNELHSLLNASLEEGKYLDEFLLLIGNINSSPTMDENETLKLINIISLLRDFNFRKNLKESFLYFQFISSINVHKKYSTQFNEIFMWIFEKIQQLVKLDDSKEILMIYCVINTNILNKSINSMEIGSFMIKNRVINKLIEQNQYYKDKSLSESSFDLIKKIYLVTNQIDNYENFKFSQINPQEIFHHLSMITPQMNDTISDEFIIISFYLLKEHFDSFSFIEEICEYLEKLISFYKNSIELFSERSKRYLIEIVSWSYKMTQKSPSNEIEEIIKQIISNGLNFEKFSNNVWIFIFQLQSMKSIHYQLFKFIPKSNLKNVMKRFFL
jgi:hypothetical protein